MKKTFFGTVIILSWATIVAFCACKRDSEVTIVELDKLTTLVPSIYLEEIKPILTVEPVTIEPVKIVKENLYEKKMSEIEGLSDDELYQWYMEYRKINSNDKPQNIYDVFEGKELLLLFQIVQAEIGDEWSFRQKCNVASVIFNRVYYENKPNFGDGLIGVLTENKQFDTYTTGRYKSSVISDSTIYACEFAFEIMDTTNGALFFESNGAFINKPEYEHLFYDGAHNFYKLKEN